jgi:glutamate dehydrogenase
MLAARAARRKDLVAAGVPEAVAARIADLGMLASATDIVLVGDRTGRPIAEVAATYFAAGAFFGLDRIAAAAGKIPVVDYFDRLALDRARDSAGDAERRLVAAMIGTGAVGPAAIDAWMASRKNEVDRIRLMIGEIVNSGLTVSKLSVTASLLGDLARA